MEDKASKKDLRQRLKLSSLFENNRVVVVISLLVAFGTWMIATGSSEDITKHINNMKINIGTDGLTVGDRTLVPFFEEGRDKDSYFVNLEVQGPQLYVNKNLTAENFTASLDMSGVDRPGVHTVNVIIKRQDGLDSSVQVLNYEPKTLSLYFDEYESRNMTLFAQVMQGEEEVEREELVPKGFLADEPTASLKTITVTGASEYINRIDRVVARVNVSEQLERTTVLDAQLVAITDSATPLKYVNLNTSEGDALPVIPRVTILVKKIYELDTALDFRKNSPENYLGNPLSYTISPSRVRIAIDAGRNPGEELLVGLLDFSQINAGINNFEFPVSALAEASSLNAYISVLSEEVSSFKVTVDASNMRRKTLDEPVNLKEKITFYSVQESFRVTALTESIEDVVVIAPNTATLEGINAASIRADVDLSGIEFVEGSFSVNAHLYIENSKDSWCFGEYPIEIEIRER